MSTTSQVTTFSDLYLDLENRVRVQTGITATENQAKRYINIALQDIALGFDYKMRWLEREAFLRTHAPYKDGTISISVGGTSVTGVTTLWNTVNSYNENNARVGGKLIPAGSTNIYDVTVVTNDTTMTINPRYVADSAASAATYIYMEDEYALASDFLKPVDFRSFTDAFNLPIISRAEFRRRFPRPNVTGRPKVCCIQDMPFSGTSAPVKKVIFYPYPSTTYIIPYNYVSNALAVTSAGVEGPTLSADSDEPNFPLRYRHAIVFHGLYHWYRDKKDDTRSQEAKAEYTDIMLRLVGDLDIGTETKAQIQPVMANYTANVRRPYRRGSRYSINDGFDRFDP
jgi:hypothetical protein